MLAARSRSNLAARQQLRAWDVLPAAGARASERLNAFRDDLQKNEKSVGVVRLDGDKIYLFQRHATWARELLGAAAAPAAAAMLAVYVPTCAARR